MPAAIPAGPFAKGFLKPPQAVSRNHILLPAADQRKALDPAVQKLSRQLPAGSPVVIVNLNRTGIVGTSDCHKRHAILLQIPHGRVIRQRSRENRAVNLAVHHRTLKLCDLAGSYHGKQHIIPSRRGGAADSHHAFLEKRQLYNIIISGQHQPQVESLILRKPLRHHVWAVVMRFHIFLHPFARLLPDPALAGHGSGHGGFRYAEFLGNIRDCKISFLHDLFPSHRSFCRQFSVDNKSMTACGHSASGTHQMVQQRSANRANGYPL